MTIKKTEIDECSKIALNKLFKSIEDKLEISNNINIDHKDTSVVLVAVVQRLLNVDINIKHR